MECIQAQTIVNDALDGCPIDAAALEAAKSHCRECPRCTQYVRALNVIRRAAPPQPPADLADRIMAAVRAEAAAGQQPAELHHEPTDTPRTAAETDVVAIVDAVAVAAEPEGDAGTPRADVPAAEWPEAAPALSELATGQRISLSRGRIDRRQLVAWGSAAAVLLVVVGVSAALGVMRLIGGEQPTRSASTGAAQMASPEPAAPTLGAGSAAGGAAENAAPLADTATKLGASGATNTPTSAYVVFNGSTYVNQGVSPQSKDELRSAGEVSLTFDATTPPASHTVYAGDAAEAIYIENDNAELLRLVLVKRMYKDTEYYLRSAEIPEYGSWPTLPPGIPRPVPENNADGSPAFVLDGNDSAGTPVYRRMDAGSETGIAIAPGTAANDPAAGNPNWTWWTPQGLATE